MAVPLVEGVEEAEKVAEGVLQGRGGVREGAADGPLDTLA